MNILKKKHKKTSCLFALAAGAMLLLSACQNKSQTEYLKAESSSPANETSIQTETSSSANVQSLPQINSYSDKVIKFNYPADWVFEENPTEDISYVDFFNSKSGSDPVFWYSRGEAWLTDFNRTEEDYKALLSESYSDVVITDLTKITIDGNEAIKLVFQYKADDVEYTMTQYETIVGPVSFQFSCTYKSDLSNDYESRLNSIIASIEFTG